MEPTAARPCFGHNALRTGLPRNCVVWSGVASFGTTTAHFGGVARACRLPRPVVLITARKTWRGGYVSRMAGGVGSRMVWS